MHVLGHLQIVVCASLNGSPVGSLTERARAAPGRVHGQWAMKRLATHQDFTAAISVGALSHRSGAGWIGWATPLRKKLRQLGTGLFDGFTYDAG